MRGLLGDNLVELAFANVGPGIRRIDALKGRAHHVRARCDGKLGQLVQRLIGAQATIFARFHGDKVGTLGGRGRVVETRFGDCESVPVPW